MKKVYIKLAFLGMVLTSPLNAQPGGGHGSTVCSGDLLGSLTMCFNAQDLDVSIAYGINEVFLNIYGVTNNGQINRCVAQYNAGRHRCASAPTLVVKAG